MSKARTLAVGGVVGGIAAALVVLAAVLAPSASAERGPDPDVGDFAFIIREALGPGSRVYDRIEWDVEHPFGWDWGGRSSYRCGMVEFLDGDVALAEVDTELFTYADVTGIPVQIIDDSPAQEPVQLPGCGASDSKAANLVWNEAAHGDHFPHADATGAGDIALYQDFDHDGFFVEFARVDYSSLTADADGVCGQGYWTPGNGPGDAQFWWDEDGPSSGDGHSSLPCPENGPTEPVAVARTTTEVLHPDVVVCTLDPINGDACSGPLAPPPPPGPTGPTGPALECFSGDLASETDGHLEAFRVCRQ